jgi:hypothetical protein
MAWAQLLNEHMGRALRIGGIMAFLSAMVFQGTVWAQGLEPLELVAPSRTITITSSAASNYTRDGEVRVAAGTTEQINGYVEFDVPRRATNLQALLTFGGDLRPRIEVFAYPAGPTNADTIVVLPREFIGAVTTNRVQEFDVTPWMAKYAGSRMGIALPVGRTLGSGSGTLTNFALRLFSPGTIDVRPRARWLDYVPPFINSNSITLRAEVSDPDSPIMRVYLFNESNRIATNSAAGPLPPGTNVVEFTVPNLNARTLPYYFSVQATSTNRPVWSELKQVTSTTNRIPRHRWLGSKADAASFYVVDAAGRAHVWGRDDSAQLGFPTIKFGEYGVKRPVTLMPPAAGQRFVQIAASRNFALALMDNGALYFWGSGRMGWHRLAPSVFSAYFCAIAVGPIGGVAMEQSGSIRGINSFGQFDSSFGYFSRELQTQNGIHFRSSEFPTLPVEARPYVDFAGDGPTTYLIGADHRLYSWPADAFRPVATAMTLEDGTGFQRIASSGTAVLAVDDVGRLWTWRTNTFPAMVQMPTGETNWLDITITTKVAMVLSANGKLYAWGEAAPGVWADPKATIARVPELVRGLPNLLDPKATEAAAAIIPPGPRMIPGELKFEAVAPAGQNTVIQSSADFLNWSFYTNLPGQLGVTTISLGVDSTSSKFFRIEER